jgi:hypothetical protein
MSEWIGGDAADRPLFSLSNRIEQIEVKGETTSIFSRCSVEGILMG